MGTITINIRDDVEESFRQTVKKEKGLGKGKLGEAVGEALQFWAEKNKSKMIGTELVQILEKGFAMGRIKFSSRDELHVR